MKDSNHKDSNKLQVTSNELRTKDKDSLLSSDPLLVTRHSLLVTDKGFTLLEVMISIAIIGGLLTTVIYTMNYHLGIAERHEFLTVGTLLAKDKISDMEKDQVKEEGVFPEPYGSYRFVTNINESSFPGLPEISVTVSNGKDKVKLTELIAGKKQYERQ